MPRSICLGVVLTTGWLGPLSVTGQVDRTFLMLKGVGTNTADVGTDLQVVGNYAYVAQARLFDTNHPGGLEIFDVSDPSRPVRVGGYNSRETANAVRVVGRYAYLAEGASRNVTNDAGVLEIIDVSDPASPLLVGGIDTPGRANGVQVIGAYAYVPQSTRWTGSNFLGALEIFDVSSPTNPLRMATHDTGGSATAVEVVGDYAYLADGVTDLQVLDVSNPSNPGRIGVYDIDERVNFGAEFAGPATYIQVEGNRVYSAGENGLHVLDVSVPSNPARIGGGNMPFLYAFHVSGQCVYTAFFSSLANTFLLYGCDVSDLANPRCASGIALPGWPKSIQVVGRRVYVTAGNLFIYEVTDLPAIRSVSRTGETLTLTWDAVPGFQLQRTSSFDDAVWTDVLGSEGHTRIELPMTGGNEFFRLARP